MSNKIQRLVQTQLEQDNDFMLKTQQQIAKDFGVFGVMFSINFETHTCTLDELFQHVSDKTLEVLQTGERQFLQLLYRIDIPENEFLGITTNEKFMSKITAKIVFREAYKVYLRSKYSA